MVKLWEHKGFVFARKTGRWHLVDFIDSMAVMCACGMELDHTGSVLEFGGYFEALKRGGICKRCLEVVNEHKPKTIYNLEKIYGDLL